MDQIFDRLEALLKSLWTQDRDRYPGTGGGRVRPSGDSDLNEAMDELDAFLRNDRVEQERLAERARREAENRARYSQNRAAGPTPSDRLTEDYRALGLPFGAPLPQVKAAYKRLLKRHHPDHHEGSPEIQRKATERSARLNEAFSRIEAWITTGKIPD